MGGVDRHRYDTRHPAIEHAEHAEKIQQGCVLDVEDLMMLQELRINPSYCEEHRKSSKEVTQLHLSSSPALRARDVSAAC